MKLEDIGFYTLSDARAVSASSTSPLVRCELILTSKCNFRCPYCRGVGGEDISYQEALDVVRLWAHDNLYAVRFSGGEPTLWEGLPELCRTSRQLGAKRIAVSTNGSASIEVYKKLLSCGVNDFSVSLDACCGSGAELMAGGVSGVFEIVTRNIRALAKETYTTVGVVMTEQNAQNVEDIIRLADDLGVSDIRIIPAAQNGNRLQEIAIDAVYLRKYPILAYRVANLRAERPVRGIQDSDANRCGLVLDDMAVCQGKHYPCIIYMRESGNAIGNVGPNMREERRKWYETHNTHSDPICRKNCLDVCVEHNNKVRDAVCS
jgi:molybdenum cofactor biosynthesis enzyme MoaA